MSALRADGSAGRAASAYFAQRRFDRGKSRVARALVPRVFPEILCTTLDGLRFAADPQDLIQLGVLLAGEWEPEESQLLRERLQPGDVVYDLGAHSGCFTLLSSKLVGTQGQVYAYEPNPAMRARLLRNLELNGITNVRVFACGVSDENATRTFSVSSGRNPGTSSLRAVGDGSSPLPIELVRIDDQREIERLRPPDFIKMDVEGAEQRAIAGMAATLAGASAELLIEVSDTFLRQMGGSEDELLALLDGLGYRMAVETSRHPKLDGRGRPFQYNAVFRRRSSAAGSAGRREDA